MSELGFRIEQSTKAFEILANNLYKDKILAVIRELCCNAYDAHVEADVPTRPFVVHIPTYNENYFMVRDYGKGLTSEQVEEIFTVFFASTKTGSSAFTGSFGLGAKTPFALVNEFFVNSYQNNRVTRYVCRKKGGVPVIECLNVESTSEENGLEIRFTLDKKDFNQDTWFEKAKLVLDAFKISPKCNLNLNFSHEEKEYECGHNWEILPNHRGIIIQMGNVRYPLVVSMLPKITEKYKDVFSHGWNYNSHGLCLHIPQKSIEITPSREEISYDENTISFLENYIDNLFQNYVTSISTKISSCNYINEAIDIYNTLSSNKKNILWDIVDESKLIYQGEPLLSSHLEPCINIAKKIQNAPTDVKETIGDDSVIPFVFGQEIILYHSPKVENSFKKIKHDMITSKSANDLTFPPFDHNRKQMTYIFVNNDMEVNPVRAARIVAMHKDIHENEYDICKQGFHVKLLLIDDVSLFCDTFGFDPSIVKNLSDFYNELGDKFEGGGDKPVKRVKAKDERIYFKIYQQEDGSTTNHAIIGVDKAVEAILEIFKDNPYILVAETSESVSKSYAPSRFKMNKLTVTYSFLSEYEVSDIIYPNGENKKILIVRDTVLTNKILEKVSNVKDIHNVFVDRIDKVTSFCQNDPDQSDIFKMKIFEQIISKCSSDNTDRIYEDFNRGFQKNHSSAPLSQNQITIQKIINSEGIFAGDPMVAEFHIKFHECFGNSYEYFKLIQNENIRKKQSFYANMSPHSNIVRLINQYNNTDMAIFYDEAYFNKFVDQDKITVFTKFFVDFINHLRNKYKILISDANYDFLKKTLVKLIESGRISLSDCM